MKSLLVVVVFFVIFWLFVYFKLVGVFVIVCVFIFGVDVLRCDVGMIVWCAIFVVVVRVVDRVYGDVSRRRFDFMLMIGVGFIDIMILMFMIG